MFYKIYLSSLGISITILLCVAQFVWANTGPELEAKRCVVSPVYATWQVQERVNNKAGKARTSHYLVSMWRGSNQVALHYSNGNITELWERLSNDKIKLVRYFEREQRGIEYMPNEIAQEQNWQDKWQLLSDDFKDSLTQKAVKGKGCDVTEVYRQKNAQQSVKLNWLEAQNLVKTYELKTRDRKIQWKLLSVSSDAMVVRSKLVSLNQYKTTDYTDIGDNEDDPFLAKMINMGFVGHGASGFYNANGEDIGDRHHH